VLLARSGRVTRARLPRAAQRRQDFESGWRVIGRRSAAFIAE